MTRPLRHRGCALPLSALPAGCHPGVLDPARPLASDRTPLAVQVVSLDCKWLFIDPEQGIAPVNELVVPVARPVHFALTSSSVPIAIPVLALAQMGVHLVFFLHIGMAPDSTNNILALAFGTIIVFLVVLGSMWIMGHLNHNLMPVDIVLQRQR